MASTVPSVLQQVLSGFRKHGESFDPSKINLQSDELRERLGIGKNVTIRKERPTSQRSTTRDTLSSWAVMGSTLNDHDELGIQHKHRSRPPTAELSASNAVRQDGALGSLFRGGQDEESKQKGRKKYTTSKASHFDDLYRGDAFDSGIAQHKRQYISNGEPTAPFKIKTDPWGDITTDDIERQKYAHRAHKSDRSDPWCGEVEPALGHHKHRPHSTSANSTHFSFNERKVTNGTPTVSSHHHLSTSTSTRRTEHQQNAHLHQEQGKDEELPLFSHKRHFAVTNAKTDPWGSTNPKLMASQPLAK
eukprot:gene4222-8479_t